MSPETALTELRAGLELALMVGGPLLLVVLAVGVTIGLAQAATQINEPRPLPSPPHSRPWAASCWANWSTTPSRCSSASRSWWAEMAAGSIPGIVLDGGNF